MEGQVTSCRRLDPHTMALGVGLFPFRSALAWLLVVAVSTCTATALNHKTAHTRDSHTQVTSHNNEREISFGTRGKTLALGPLRRGSGAHMREVCAAQSCVSRHMAHSLRASEVCARCRSPPPFRVRRKSSGGGARWRWEIILAKLQAGSSLRCTKLYQAGAVLVFLSVSKNSSRSATFCALCARVCQRLWRAAAAQLVPAQHGVESALDSPV